MIKKNKLVKVSVVDKKLWTVFSRYIRARDAKVNKTPNRCRCFTCGNINYINKMQAGHYISRVVKEIKYDEINVHAQCVGCNIYRYGEQALYREEIVARYGEKEAVRLLNTYLRHKAGKGKRLSAIKLTDLLDIYTKKLAVLQRDGWDTQIKKKT